jgi:hypothetical protein
MKSKISDEQVKEVEKQIRERNENTTEKEQAEFRRNQLEKVFDSKTLQLPQVIEAGTVQYACVLRTPNEKFELREFTYLIGINGMKECFTFTDKTEYENMCAEIKKRLTK